MKILFYCPFNFNLKTIKNSFLGGIESLNIDLSKEIAKRKKYKVYLASLTNKKTISSKVTNIPIDELIQNNNNYSFDYIISSNDSKIFDKFQYAKKIFWMHNTLSIEKAVRKKKLVPLLVNNITTVFVSKFLMNITSSLYFFNKKRIISNFLTRDFIFDKVPILRNPIFVWTVQRNRGLAETL